MCYHNKIEYRIVPDESYRIIRNCPGCGCRKIYVSTGNFRVNANGKQVDVWLIYQCEVCKSTYNLPIYERVKAGAIPKDSYRCFLENDSEAALRYGTDRKIFAKSKAEIDWGGIAFQILRMHGEEDFTENGEGCCILAIDNPWELKVRADRVAAEILHTTRSRVRQQVRAGELILPRDYIGRYMEMTLTRR